MEERELRERAKKIAEGKMGFQIHLGVYISVNLFLVVIWYITGFPRGTGFPWFIFPLFGWGIGLVAHFLATYVGEGRMSERAEREYQRLKRQRSQ